MRIANPQSFNRYSYVQSDPVNFVDPNGLDIFLPLPFLRGPIGPGTSVVNIYGSFIFGGLGVGGGGGGGGGLRDLLLEADTGAEGGGGGPIIRPDATPPLDKIEAAIQKCLGLFTDLNGMRAVDLIQFDPSSPGHSGRAQVDYLDPKAVGRKGIYTITNNVTRYSSVTSPNAVGFTSQNPGKALTNYTISDRDQQNSFDPRLQGIVGGFIATQVHEMGNSIAAVSGNYIGHHDAQYNGTPDSDSGYQLQLCVMNELQNMGYNGH